MTRNKTILLAALLAGAVPGLAAAQTAAPTLGMQTWPLPDTVSPEGKAAAAAPAPAPRPPPRNQFKTTQPDTGVSSTSGGLGDVI